MTAEAPGSSAFLALVCRAASQPGFASAGKVTTALRPACTSLRRSLEPRRSAFEATGLPWKESARVWRSRRGDEGVSSRETCGPRGWGGRAWCPPTNNPLMAPSWVPGTSRELLFLEAMFGGCGRSGRTAKELLECAAALGISRAHLCTRRRGQCRCRRHDAVLVPALAPEHTGAQRGAGGERPRRCPGRGPGRRGASAFVRPGRRYRRDSPVR